MLNPLRARLRAKAAQQALNSAIRLPWQFFERVGREAKTASPRDNLLKTLGQTLVMWTIFLFLGPLVAYSTESWLGGARFRFGGTATFVVSVVIFVVGWLVAWSSAYFMVTRGEGTPLPAATTRRLVVAGPYRFIRNPMAFGSLAQGAAIGLVLGSPLVLLYIVCGALLWNFLARPWEEFDLERRFGDDYRRYKAEVRCWVPRLRPYDASSASERAPAKLLGSHRQ